MSAGSGADMTPEPDLRQCYTCQHVKSVHGEHGACLMPDCKCGKSLALTFEFYVIQDGISWLVPTTVVETGQKFEFAVGGETEDEAIWNAQRVLRKARWQVEP